MWAIPTGAGWLLKKKKKVPFLSLASRKPVRIRQSGRAGIRGVTLNLAHSLEVDQLEVYSDSQLVVRQIEDTYKAKSGRMILYLRKVRDLLKKFVLVQVKHVPRAENS